MPKLGRHWILVATALAFVVVLFASNRPWSVVNRPGFERVAEVPPAAQRPMRLWLRDRGIKLPWPGVPEAEQPQLTLGYAYREVGALAMPFAAYGDPGMVLFDGRGRWGPAVPLDGEAEAELTRLAGRSLADDYTFPLWRYLWGWLFVVPLAAWYWLQLRAEAARKDAEGIL